ncbi:MAG: adenylate/guanylate cyclase domain-containing protein [Desulfobacterales bacterium]|nr:adenylate/guanylate cyclase domain-containing protein [Desulfobacterales bacterium]MCP4162007.1 adenylate/guanylate cyclase domain-containing protein [Deltaproteobacteria bacterium]
MRMFKGMIPFWVKILTVSGSMLILLISLSLFTYIRIGMISNELEQISNFLIPLEDRITNIGVHAIEQEIHLERIWFNFERKPINYSKIEKEKNAFEERGKLVDKEIEKALILTKKALNHIYTKKDILEFANIQTILEDIENEHQNYHDHAIKIINLLLNNNKKTAHILEENLEKEEDELNEEMEKILVEIIQYTERAVLTAEEHEKNVLKITIIIVIVAVIIGLFYATIMTIGLMKPVRALITGTKKVEDGDLFVEVPVTTHDEIGEMTSVFNNMVVDIREKERIKDTFGQFVDPRIVENLIKRSSNQLNKGEKKPMTVFFSDLEGFTKLSELLTADGLVNLINNYLTLASEPIIRFQGVIDKYIGDAVSAFWGEPFCDENEHATLACEAALEQFIQLEKLRKRLPDLLHLRKGLPSIDIRIGIATGDLIAGNIGSTNLQSYTVMGKPVGLAEKLEQTNKIFGTKILLSEQTAKLVYKKYELRKIGRLTINKSGNKMSPYELLGRCGECSEATKELRDIFQQGVSSVHNKKWEKALKEFKNCLRINKNDKPSLLYHNKVNAIISSGGGVYEKK